MAFFSPGSKLLHWLIALIVILLLSFSFYLDDVGDANKPLAFMLHKSFGLTVLALMLIRLAWIQWHGKPPLPQGMPRWEKVLARTVQYSLYLLLIAMPLSGWMMSVAAGKTPSFFGLFEVPLPLSPNKALSKELFTIHQVIAYVLIGLIVLHVIGAFKHHFIDKDDVLKRMLPD